MSSGAPAAQPLLRLEHVSKNFGPVQALTDVNLELRAGEVTALIGDNGAGKSVMIKTISGIHGPDGGQIFWEGKPVRIRTPRDAAALGIETVFQDLALCNNLDIVQNMFLGRERDARRSCWTRRRWRRRRRRRSTSLAVTTVRSIRQPVASLSGGQRQSVAIAKAVLWNTKLVIMDEPTAALGVAQTAMVLDLVRRLADRGLAVMLVSHNMNDVFEVADRIAVLCLGKIVALRPAAEMDPPDRGRPDDAPASRRGLSPKRRIRGRGGRERCRRTDDPDTARAATSRADDGDRGGRPQSRAGAAGRARGRLGRRLPQSVVRADQGRARAVCCRWSAGCS